MPFFKDEHAHTLVVQFAAEIVGALSALDTFTQNNAAMQEHLKLLKKVVQGGGLTIDAVGPGGSTPLLMACSQGNLAAATSLLAAGADPCFEALEWDDTL